MRGIFLPPVDNSDVREETSVRGGSYSTVAVYENAIVNEVLKKLVERGALTTAQQDRLSALLTRGLSQEQCDVVAREIQGIYKEVHHHDQASWSICLFRISNGALSLSTESSSSVQQSAVTFATALALSTEWCHVPTSSGRGFDDRADRGESL